MKIKIIIAILAAALLAYAGSVRSQIIIIDPLPGYGSYEDCYDAEFEKRHLIRKAELPTIKTLASEFKSVAGKHSAITEHVASSLCAEAFGLPEKTLDPGLESTTKTLLEEMDAAGVKLSAEFMKVFAEAGLIEEPSNACDWVMCACGDPYDCNVMIACPQAPLKLYSPEGCDAAACVPGEFNGQYNVCEEGIPLPPCVCVDEFGVGWGDKGCVVDASVPACCTSWDYGCVTKLGDPISCDLPCDSSMAVSCGPINEQPEGCAMNPFTSIKCHICL